MNATSVLDGRAVFRLVDTHGLPLPVIREELRKRHLAFDVEAFVVAARDSGNWSGMRLYRLLADGRPDEVKSLFRGVILRAYQVGDVRPYAGAKETEGDT